MLSKLTLNNFKCYRSQEIDFSDLTVFSGINGAGKSTVIQAILFLRQIYFRNRNKQGDRNVELNGPLVRFGSIYDLRSSWITGNEDETIKITAEECGGEEYSVSLKKLDSGTHHEEKDLRQMQILNEEKQKIPSVLGDDFVYLSAERFGPRISFDVPSSDVQLNKFGAAGEFTVWHIFNEKCVKNEKLLKYLPEPEEKNFQYQLNNCYSELGKDIRITVQYLQNVEKMTLSFAFAGAGGAWGKDFRPINVGFGLTYSLPIYTALLAAKEKDLLIIENPEAHLHPKGQVAIGMFIAKAAAAGVQVIIETHSDHVLNGIRLAVKRKIISNTSVKLNFVTNNNDEDGAKILSPKIMENGRIDEWPEGFFDEYENVLAELF